MRASEAPVEAGSASRGASKWGESGTYTFLTMLADVAVKKRTGSEVVGDEVVFGKRNGREVEEEAFEIEEENWRAARGSRRRRGLSDAMLENLAGGWGDPRSEC